jgi:predicted ATPase
MRQLLCPVVVGRDAELAAIDSALGRAADGRGGFLSLVVEAGLGKSRIGCLLVLEDMQWADAGTLAVVEYLADNLDAEPVLCLGTVRTGSTTVPNSWSACWPPDAPAPL